MASRPARWPMRSPRGWWWKSRSAGVYPGWSMRSTMWCRNRVRVGDNSGYWDGACLNRCKFALITFVYSSSLYVLKCIIKSSARENASMHFLGQTIVASVAFVWFFSTVLPQNVCITWSMITHTLHDYQGCAPRPAPRKLANPAGRGAGQSWFESLENLNQQRLPSLYLPW